MTEPLWSVATASRVPMEMSTAAYVGVVCGWGEGVGLDIGGALFRVAQLAGTRFAFSAAGGER